VPSLRVPVSWLREYVDVPVSPADLAERLHLAGIEVDHVERGGDWDDKVYVGRIAALERHPNADRLQLATVDFGDGRRKQVVTGAFNIAVGDVVPYAETGAELIDGHTGERAVLRPKPMRGIVSEGMVLSAKELGLGEDHDGILQLDKGLRVGAPLRDALGETIIHFEIAPNRPDALSVLGIAREAAAVLGSAFHHPHVEPLTYSLDPALLTVRIEDDQACPRFMAAYLTDVTIGASPAWMQERLRAAGMRPIDAVVDITNYVMLETGQPLHGYDADRLRGRTLVARLAGHNETLRTLDGVDRILRPSDLVIADEERALGLAGIMGGEDSEIRASTTTVALECANFEPRRTRRSADAHRLSGSSGSAAARRFSLDLSPEIVPIALARAVHLLREHAGARLVGATDVYPRPRSLPNVRLRFSDIHRVLGAEIARDEAVDALRRLGFAHAELGDQLVVTPPAIRTDIGIPEDIVEEVARIVGYERIPVRVPTGVLPLHERHPLEQLRERVRDALVGFGLQETISYALIDPAWLGRLTPDGSSIAPEPLAISNPTSVAQSALRPTLRASLLDTAVRNLKHRKGIAIFEIDPVYLPHEGDLPEERWTIAILLAGQAEPAHESETWLVKEREWDWHDILGLTRGLADALHLGPFDDQTRRPAPGLHPGRSFSNTHGGRTAFAIGQLDPRVAQMWEVPSSTYLAEIDLPSLLGVQRPPAAVAPPRYPAALRDIAFVVEESVPWADVRGELEASGAKGGLESIALRDVYRGPQAGAGKKSFAVRLVFRSATGTLSDAEIDRAIGRIEGRLGHRFGAEIRG
jgi:phenylalanyl-tRNA synthetase beta chain